MAKRAEESNVFRDVASWKKDLESAEIRLEKWKKRKCDWDDPEDVKEYRRYRSFLKATRILDRLVPERICPSCREQKTGGTRTWIPNKRRNKVICRSCWLRLFLVPRLEKEGELSRIRMKQAMARAEGGEARFIFNGVSLQEAILLAGMSNAHFSRRCGWSAPYTHKLVMGMVKTVNPDTAKVILMVLAEGDVEMEMTETDYFEIYGVKRGSGSE